LGKTTYAIIAVVVLIVVIGIAAYILFYNPFGTDGGNGTPTTTPTPTPTAGNVGSATNLTFSASVTSQGQTTIYNWIGQDIHSDTPILRVDFANYAYIMDAGSQVSWNSVDSGGTWTAGNFTADWIAWSPQWTTYVDNLTHWSGSGDYSYTNPAEEAIVITDIVVDGEIPSSAFETT